MRYVCDMTPETDPIDDGEDDERHRRRQEAEVIFKAIEERTDFRFAVGSEDVGYSETWIAWSNRNDYYIGSKNISGSLKVSLHAPRGDKSHYVGRVAMPREYLNGRPHLNIEPNQRAYTEWRLHPPPEEGAVPVAVVVFPTNGLRKPEPKGKMNKPLIIFSPAPKDHAVEVWFFYSREPAHSLEEKLKGFGNPVLRSDLESGDAVMVVVRQQPFDMNQLPIGKTVQTNVSQWFSDGSPPSPGTKMDGLTATRRCSCWCQSWPALRMPT